MCIRDRKRRSVSFPSEFLKWGPGYETSPGSHIYREYAGWSVDHELHCLGTSAAAVCLKVDKIFMSTRSGKSLTLSLWYKVLAVTNNSYTLCILSSYFLYTSIGVSIEIIIIIIITVLWHYWSAVDCLKTKVRLIFEFSMPVKDVECSLLCWYQWSGGQWSSL